MNPETASLCSVMLGSLNSGTYIYANFNHNSGAGTTHTKL
jgi:hypothetical protein